MSRANQLADTSKNAEIKDVAEPRRGWDVFSNNVATVQLLGLCPLLAVSSSIATALGLAVASTFVLIGSATIVSLIRKLIPDNVRLPIFVLVIATFTTVAVMIMEAFLWSIYWQIALFMQIIVTNCMILGRINLVASRSTVGQSIIDAGKTSIEFAFILLLLGAVREVIMPVFPLAQHPAGAFLIFGLLIALQNTVGDFKQKRQRRRIIATAS